jgi:Ca2+-binding RTX toxin-like protein
MPRRILLTAAVLAAAVVLPSAAQAATIYPDGRTPHQVLLYAPPDETNLVTVEGDQHVVITDDGTPLQVEGVPTCMPIGPNSVRCSAVRGIELELGNGPDVAVIATPHEVSIDAGIGQDRYVALGTDAPSRVDFEGDDRIAGGPGQDTLSGGHGDDRIDAADGELDAIDCGGQPFDVLLADSAEASIAGCG